jgi:hypothetical protein
VLKFDGFLEALYLESKDDEETEEDIAGMLPLLKTGQSIAIGST